MALYRKLKMFKTLPKTPADFFKPMADFYASLPKTPEQVKELSEKVKLVVKTEGENTADVWKTYYKASKGDASVTEITEANKKAKEVVKAAAFAGLVSMPGMLFVLPTILEKAKEYDLDLVPKSVAKQFNI